MMKDKSKISTKYNYVSISITIVIFSSFISCKKMCYVSSSVQSSPYIAHFGVMETQLVWVNYMKHLARPNCGKSKLLTGAEYVENYSKKDPDGKPTEVK